MAITNSLKTLFPGFGNPTLQAQLLSQTFAINATTTKTFSSFTPVTTCRSGWVRIHGISYPGAGAGQITGIKITGSDGTNTVELYMDTTSRTASDLPDLIFPFITELSLTSVAVAITMANVANGQLSADLELVANP